MVILRDSAKVSDMAIKIIDNHWFPSNVPDVFKDRSVRIMSIVFILEMILVPLLSYLFFNLPMDSMVKLIIISGLFSIMVLAQVYKGSKITEKDGYKIRKSVNINVDDASNIIEEITGINKKLTFQSKKYKTYEIKIPHCNLRIVAFNTKLKKKVYVYISVDGIKDENFSCASEFVKEIDKHISNKT